MIEYLTIGHFVATSAGACLGAVVMGLLSANRVATAEAHAAAKSRAEDELMLLRARVRAIQENGKPCGKGERIYTVQTPKGRFSKLTLPEV